MEHRGPGRPPKNRLLNVNRKSRFPLRDSNDDSPVLPLTRIVDQRYQALFTTYPARMKLGTSSLMQPSNNTLTVGTNTPILGSKRSRTQVNYAETEGLADESEEEINLPTPKKTAQWGDGKSYLGALPPARFVIVQPAKMVKASVFTDEQLQAQSEKPDLLIPIQVDLDVDNFKIRDSFVWNLNEKLITPETFARTFCEDLDIPMSNASDLAKQIHEQIDENVGVTEIPIRSQEEEEEFIEKDLRVMLNIDVQIGSLRLTDRIEWDLSSSLPPELFAAMLVKDLSLPPSSTPLISHAIYEELHRHKKYVIENGLIADSEAGSRKKGAKALEGVWREYSDCSSFGPRIEVLSLEEMERIEAERERATRRAKRDRAGVVNVPRVYTRRR